VAATTTAFGLDVWANRPLPFLEGGEVDPTGRRLDLAVEDEGSDLGWPAKAELISDQRHRDGSVSFQIESSPAAGYRIWGPEYGASVLSGDGRRLRSAPAAGEQEWQRMLIAQVLPFASVLRGLEVLHASAVVLDGAAVAISGPSGAGKTSLAIALSRLGGTFLADDVLAIERVGDGLVAHPGAPIAGIDREEAERLRLAGAAADAPAALLGANRREEIVRVEPSAAPAPLGALFFLERRPDGPDEPSFAPAPDAQPLLSATFNLVLASPQRLQRLLEISALAARTRVERVLVGPAVDATELAAVLAARIGAAP
jgi:hypothetical protein